MNLKTNMLAVIAAASLVATPAWAYRGHGHGQFWGPFGFLLGSAIVYSAIQPRTVYYTPQVTYWSNGPVGPAYYYVDPTYAGPPVASLPPPPQGSSQISALGSPGSEWWYFCKEPSGYYPYVRECQSGWEKVSPTPPGAIKP